MALVHAVHHARKNGWICVFIPNGWEYMQAGGYVNYSRCFKGYFDQPDLSQNTLKHVQACHAHQLNELVIQDPIVLKRYELKKGASLKQMYVIFF